MSGMVDTTCRKCRRRFGFFDTGKPVACAHCGAPWERSELDELMADMDRLQAQDDMGTAIRIALHSGSTLLANVATEIGVDRMKLRALLVGESALSDEDAAKVRAWMAERVKR